jgi:hypothetical protein
VLFAVALELFKVALVLLKVSLMPFAVVVGDSLGAVELLVVTAEH